MRRDQQWLEARVGLADARRLWEFALGARAHLDWLIESYAIDCDLRLGHLHADHRARYTRGFAPPCRAPAHDYGYPHIRFVDREELAAMVATAGYYSGSFDERAGHLHALNLALGIARAAASHGARLHEGVEVTGIAAAAPAAGRSRRPAASSVPSAWCWPATATCAAWRPRSSGM